MNEALNPLMPFPSVEGQQEGNLAGTFGSPWGGRRPRRDSRGKPGALSSACSLQWIDAVPDGEKDAQPELWLVPGTMFTSERYYPVMRKRRLPQEFLRLAQNDAPRRILEFANQYGWLDRTRLRVVAPSWELTDEAQLPAAIIALTGRTSSSLLPLRQHGEPISFWRAELASFLELRTAWDALMILEQEDRHTPTQVRDATRELERRVWMRTPFWTREQARWHRLVQDGSASYRPGSARESVAPVAKGELIGAVRTYIRATINKRLDGHIKGVLQDGRPAGIRYFPDSLVTAIYLHMALQYAGVRLPERTCEFCGEVFYQRRRDQRFCGKQHRELSGYHRRRGLEPGQATG